jgi:hypothetical protein
VAVRLKFPQGKEQVERAHHVVDLGKYRMFAVDHGIRRRTLLGKMDHGLRLILLNDGGKKIIIGHVADETIDGVSGDLIPGLDSV